MVDIYCAAASTIPIEVRKSWRGYQVKKAPWQDFFLGCSIVTGQDDIDIMDSGHQIVFKISEVACPKTSEITGFGAEHSID